MHVQPYLFFDGRCEEALRYYERAIDARVVTLIRNRDSGAPVDAATAHRINHAVLRVGDSVLMAADDDDAQPMPFRGFALSLRAKDAAEAKRRFDALADGGVVRIALAPTPWSAAYGMVTDRFGIGWMVSVVADDAA